MKKAENGKEASKNQRIQVFARCRPINSFERKQFSPVVVEANSERKEVKIKDDKMINKTFIFDKVFGPDTTQIAVYKAVVGPLIREVLMGYNCTVFAYGQTGTGKTFTMEGERSNGSCSWEEDPNAGIIPRSLHQLFEELTREENVEFSAHVSFLELYNEELFDLLSQNDLAKLRLFEDSARKGSVVIQGLEEIKVNTKDEVYAILEQGTSRRQKAATLLNATSSRSHTVFSVTVHIKENTIDGEELLKTGKLNLVDLAGSENIGRSGASQKTAREAGNINQSLLTLGRVITALVEKAPHIPYRESKLTRLLQDSLGGHTKTSIIATVSPALCNIDETISTLDYAQRAKNITIKPEVNQKMTKKALIKEYTEEIERLRKDLVAMRDQSGFYIDTENYNLLQQKITFKSQEVTELENKLEAITAEMEKIQQLFTNTSVELSKTNYQLNKTTKMYTETTERLCMTKRRLKHAKKVLNDTRLDRDKKQYVNNVQNKMKKELHKQAEMILHAANESENDAIALHCKVDRKQHVENMNEEKAKKLRLDFQKGLIKIDDSIQGIEQNQNGALQRCQTYVDQTSEVWNSYSASVLSSSNVHDGLQKEFVKRILSLCKTYSTYSHQWDENIAKEFSDELNNYLELKEDFNNKFMSVSNSMKENIDNVRKELEILHQGSVLLIKTYRESTKKMSEVHSDSLLKVQEMFKESQSQQAARMVKNEQYIQALLGQIAKSEQLQKDFYQAIQDCNKMKSDLVIQNQNWVQQDNSTVFATHQESERKLKELHDLGDEVYSQSVLHFEQNSSYEVEWRQKENDLFGALCFTHKGMEDVFQTFVEKVPINPKRNEEFSNSMADKKTATAALIAEHEEAIEAITARLQSLREEDEENFKDKNNIFNTICTNQLSDIACAKKALKEEVGLSRNSILNCDMDIEKFVSEELVKDIPTGTTPIRKTYDYPRRLIEIMSPAKILEDLEQQINPEQDIAGNQELPSSLDDSQEHNASVDHAVQHEADVESDCSVSSRPGDENVKNKENQSSTALVSSIPRRSQKKAKSATKTFVKPSVLVPFRKPLFSSSENIQSET